MRSKSEGDTIWSVPHLLWDRIYINSLRKARPTKGELKRARFSKACTQGEPFPLTSLKNAQIAVLPLKEVVTGGDKGPSFQQRKGEESSHWS